MPPITTLTLIGPHDQSSYFTPDTVQVGGVVHTDGRSGKNTNLVVIMAKKGDSVINIVLEPDV